MPVLSQSVSGMAMGDPKHRDLRILKTIIIATILKFNSTYTSVLKRNPYSPEACDIVTSPSGVNHPALEENSETGN